MERLAGRFLVVRVNNVTSWPRCYRHQQVAYVPNQQGIRYSNHVTLSLKKWLPDAFMVIRNKTKRKHRWTTVRDYMADKLPFIRRFTWPSRISLMIVRYDGWIEHSAALPQNAAEAIHMWNLLKSFLASCPFLLHAASHTDYGNDDFI
jgi:hypothetical protein